MHTLWTTGRAERTMERLRRLCGAFFKTLLCFAALAFTPGSAFGQNRDKLDFEVASVRPTGMERGKLKEQAKAGKPLSIGKRISGTRVEYTYMSLFQLIREAYSINSFQVIGPDWLNSDRFDIVCRMPEGARKEDAPAMLQSLLESRFKLVARRELKPQRVMALVVGKQGPQLRQAAPEDQPRLPDAKEREPEKKARGSNAVGRATNPSFRLRGFGSVSVKTDTVNSLVHFSVSRCTMSRFVELLTSLDLGEGRPVVDMTGLDGEYEVALDIPERQFQKLGGAGTTDASNANSQDARPADMTPDAGGTTVERSLRSLGLKLESRKGPVEHLIVEHIDRVPTEN